MVEKCVVMALRRSGKAIMRGPTDFVSAMKGYIFIAIWTGYSTKTKKQNPFFAVCNQFSTFAVKRMTINKN